MHDGHPIEPVLVAGVPHREDARPVPQQRALQPAGNIPCNHREILLSAEGWANPAGEARLTFDLGPLLLGALHRVHHEARGHADREVAATNCVTLQQSKALPLRPFSFFLVSFLSLPWGNHPSVEILLVRRLEKGLMLTLLPDCCCWLIQQVFTFTGSTLR